MVSSQEIKEKLDAMRIGINCTSQEYEDTICEYNAAVICEEIDNDILDILRKQSKQIEVQETLR